MTKALIPFISRDSKEQSYLTYDLYQHSITQRWMEIVKKSQLLGSSFEKNETIYGGRFHTIEELSLRINQALNFLKIAYREIWQKPLFDPIRNGVLPHQNQLNTAHIFFEETFSTHAEAECISNLHLLNRSIHQMEAELSGENGFFIDAVLWNSVRGKILPEENKFFSLDRKWGELYLSYCHIGVSYFEAMATNYQGIPTPQDQISGNVVLDFQDDFSFSNHDQMKAWLKKHFKDDIPFENLPLGRVPLGRLEGEWSDRTIMEFFKLYPHMGREIRFL